MKTLNKNVARKVLQTVDCGLVSGVGTPEPGKMCVEAAVCFALGLPHGDDPKCVAQSVRRLKISLNDARWSSPAARAKGLRRLAIAQLGTAVNFDEVAFAQEVAKLASEYAAKYAKYAAEYAEYAEYAAKYAAKSAAESAAKYAKYAAEYAEYAAEYAAKYAAEYAAKYAAEYAAESAAKYDKVLSDFAEDVVQILIMLKAQGTKWLDITEEN